MQIFSFNFLSYPYLPQDYAGSAWITCPNELYDPKIGHGLYRDYLDQLVHTEALGFDGIGLNEHHQTPYCGMPSPNIVASALIQRTTTARICVLGNALPLYDPPLRVAEEYAMLDVMSGGRLMAGVVPGDQASYYSYGVNPAQARARFAEALDLLVQAWTRPGPFEFNGEFYRFPYVNPWPRPLQQPHPPIWIPGLGSPETQEMVAARRFHYASLPFLSRAVVNANFASFRKVWSAAGHAPAPDHLGMVIPVYVAEDDAKARAEYEEHYLYFTQKLTQGANVMAPGYTSAAGIMRMMKAAGETMSAQPSWEQMVADGGFMAVGSPATVVDQLSARIRETGIGNLFLVMSLGSLPHRLAMKNLELFAGKVMPALRREFPQGGPWDQADALTAPSPAAGRAA
jgi:alkanesulfonate monooxygenase SsuD/methylene tetrahydromethanopterin reductase-like flavin-dependent oxidoreductase (luciferase family)